MDFTFTEEQQAAAETARTVFADVAPDAVPSPALTPTAVADDLDRPLWQRLAATDLLGLLAAPEHGGTDLDPVALCLVLRESARVLARVPLLETAAVTHVLQHHAPAATAAALLPEVSAGRLLLTAAAHGATGHEPAEHAVTARRDSTHWILDGTTDHVPWAHHADLTAVPDHTADGRTILALLPRDHPGLTLDAQYGTHGERLTRLRLDATRLPADHVLDSDTDYPLHRYHAWAKYLELSLGPAAAHEEALGDLITAHPLD